MYFPALTFCAICMHSTALVFDETFAITSFAIASCAVPGLSEFYYPVCFDLSILGVRHFRRTDACRARKHVIDKTFT